MNPQKDTRVLIVEDEPLVGKMVQGLLERMGYSVAGIALDGKQAIAMTEEIRPDVVLMDIQLPDMDGIEATHRIQETCPTPVVVLTAHETPELVERASAAGVGAYLVKPPQAHELERVITLTIARFSDVMALRRLNAELQAEIAERVRAEESLRESEKQFRDLFEGLPAPCFTYDRAGTILHWNPACEVLYGWTARQAIGKTAYELMVKDENVASAREKVAVIFQGQSFQGIEYQDLRADGTTCDVLISEYPLRDASGQVTMGICAALDITERKRTEEALRKSEEQFRAIFETAQDSIFIKDRALRYTQVNPAMKRLFGLPASELIGRTDEDIFGEEAGAHVKEVDSSVLGGEIVEEEHTKLVKGIPKTFHVIKVPMCAGSGEIIGLCGIARDITERKRAAEALRRRGLEQETVSRIARALNTLDVRDAFPVLVEGLRNLTACDRVSLALIDEASEHFIMSTLESPFPVLEEGTVMPLSASAAAEDVLAGRPHLTADLSTELALSMAEGTDFPAEQALYQAGFRSRVNLPLLAGGEPIGAFNLGSRQLGLFREDQLPVLQQIADVLASAVENSRLFEGEQRQRRQADTLREAALALTTALDQDEVIERILAQLQRVVPYDTGSVQLLRASPDRSRGEDRLEIVGGRGFPSLQDVVGLSFPVDGDNPNSEVVRTRAPLILEDAPTVYETFRRLPRARHIRSWLGAPMLVGERLVGMLALDKREPGFYTQEHARLAEAFAAQAAIAVENARLFRAEREQRELAEALEEAAAVVSGTLNLDEVLDCILEQVERVVSGDAFSIMLVEDDHTRVVRWRGHERFGAEEIISTVGWRVPEVPNLQQMVETGRPVIIPDTGAYSGWVDVPGLEWLRSYVAAPIQVSGLTVGFLNVDGTQPGQFDLADARRLEAFASHAATAIENAQLYRELQAYTGQLEQRVRERTAELSAANEELVRALRLKDEFLATMSHELRTPLNAILGMSEVLRREIYGSLNQKQLKSVRTIETSGRHLLNLINDILDVSKIEAGEMALELGPVSAESVCQASMRFIEQKAQAKRLRVTLTVDSVVTFLQADERRLKQILVNLLSNAVKFTPEGGAVGLEMMGDTAGHKVHFTVWDTGIGIAEEDIGRLFQPFVQLDGSLSRRYEGTGLGLWLVYRLAEMHGGSVSVESEVGKGSRFTVSLPWSPAESRPPRLIG